MDQLTFAVFAFVYLAMVVGRVPGLMLDRTGAALLGAIVLLAANVIDPDHAWRCVDVPTIGLLLAMMIVSAQLRLGGFYAAVARRLGNAELTPDLLLAMLIMVAGVLSAILANDIVCLAMTPVLLEGCRRRRLKAAPFLIALACASNVGSAATLIGNPQNILIGESLKLDFARYVLDASVPALGGMAVTWLVVRVSVRGQWYDQAATSLVEAQTPALKPWQVGKGLAVVAVLMFVFLFVDWPRDVVALAAAGLLLMSRKMHSREMLGMVDWQLLLLFISLFIVNHAMEVTGNQDAIFSGLAASGVDVADPATLFLITPVLSNIVSNVPAVMLLLPKAAHPHAGTILAISSTLAGNLFIIGSIANIIVVEQAAMMGEKINWKQHAKIGVPVTLLSMAIAAAWLWVRIAAIG